MQLDSQLVYSYLSNHKSMTVMVNSMTAYQLVIDPATDGLMVVGIGNDVAIQDRTVYCYGGQHNLMTELTFTESSYELVKTWLLEKYTSNEIKSLVPAAKQMLCYYNTPDVIGVSSVNIYKLAHIDFRQQGKGHVILVIDNDAQPISRPADVFKGYIWDSTTNTVRYETVQAWRYLELSEADYKVFDSRMQDANAVVRA